MPLAKDVLLVNPWIFDFTAYDFWLRPLGLLYLAAVIRENTDCRVHFLDCLDRFHPLLEKKAKTKPDGRGHFLKEEVPKPEVLKGVPRRFSRYGIPVPLFERELGSLPRPAAVLLTSGMTYWYPGVQLAVELIRGKWGRVPVVLGGIYATLAAEHARRHSGADAVIPGAGENAILPLLKEILGDKAVRLREFAGLEEMPFPAFDLLRNRRALPLLTSRGCPFRCSFCATPLLHPFFEQRSPRSVLAEIETNVRRWGATNLSFYDDALLIGKEKHIIPLLERVVDIELPVCFHTPNGLHVREIDSALARLFHQARVRSLYLSQESLDERLLQRACPKVAPRDLERALAFLEKAGYPRRDVNVYLITGLPGQDMSRLKESIRRVRRLGARPRLAFFSPVPGTAEWTRLVAKGCLGAGSDPLLHNKLTFAYLWGGMSREEFASLGALLAAES
jgi:radical SAM superfamily enzyme YgiQ (UPF0313 family)